MRFKINASLLLLGATCISTAVVSQASKSLVGTYQAFGPTTNNATISYCADKSTSSVDVDSLVGFLGGCGLFVFNCKHDSMYFYSPWGCSMYYYGYATYSADFDTINLPYTQYIQGIKSGSSTDYYKFVRIPTSIDNLYNNSLLNIYPNPCTDNLNCTFPSKYNVNDLKLSVFNTLGELQYCTTINSLEINKELSINTSKFSPGIYVLVVSDGVSNYIKKFIKE